MEPLHTKYLLEQRQKLQERHERGETGLAVAGWHASFIDVFIISVFNSLEIRSQLSRGKDEPECVVLGLGGFGRKELSPFSDIDLLFLFPQKMDPSSEEIIRKILYPFWDVGYEVGYTVQSLEECLQMAETDFSFLTSLLDLRRVTGNPSLFQALKSEISRRLKGESGKHWQEWIVAESEKRHHRYGDSAFFLEPHLKEGLGGLRDIHLLLWLGKALYDAPDFYSLEKVGLLTWDDRRSLSAAQNYLLRLRHQLHYPTGRKNDRLSFEYQAALASWLEASGQEGILPVESFMREVYQHLQDVHIIHQNFFERLAELRHPGGKERRPLEPGVYVEDGRIYLESARILIDRPAMLMKLFWYALKEQVSLSQETIRLLKQCLFLIDDSFQRSPEVSRLFLEIISDGKISRALLESLLQTGLLTRYLPELEPTICRTQFDTYHVYTVDMHLLLTLVELKKIGQGAYLKEEPLLYGLWGEVPDFPALFLAALLHDIGKGVGRGHARQGARLIPWIAGRINLTPEAAKTVGFLVEHHLLLSEAAQLRDLNDEELIIRLAQIVQDPGRLKMLYLLTYADALATSFRAWNNWKSMLVRELFFKLLRILEQGELGTGQVRETLAANQEEILRRSTPEMPRKEAQSLLAGMPAAYLLSVPPEKAAGHLKLLRDLDGQPLVWSLEKKEEIVELFICCHDRPGLFSRLTGVLSLNGINILGAQIFTRPDKIALDIFQVQPPLDPLFEEETWGKVHQQFLKAIQGKLSLDYRLAEKKPSPLLATGLPPAPESRVVTDNQGSDFYTILEVYTQDRLGILYTITKALFEAEINIHYAKISTKVDQVVDVFYLTDVEGQKIWDEEQIEEIKQAILFAIRQ
ncbi:MAG: [protein-PII] uridylyltransferase [Deltaproteobacteria bacterium]|nr:[protein-PII] uridylyltransferase [Deltaproteobacteria bacterium]